ncbi:MAG: methionyl-tRNA formyltransferase [Heliobacteriaceae bacterium]|nr:methionyl-tRNA formyltransferase [Heliobacteriaceae bacterium]
MIKIVFFGTPQIALKSLEYLYNSEKIEVLALVTQPDKPAGRGHTITQSPVKKFALSKGLPVFQPKSIRKEPEIQAALRELKPDFFVTFAFGQILSQEVLDIPVFETVNLHASLLPEYRGANPIQRAIINGDKETGITTMITTLELDAGDICLSQKIQIPENMTINELNGIISEKSPELIERTLTGLYDGTLVPVPQYGEVCRPALKLSKNECVIDWNNSANDIHNLVRGICGCPSAYFTLNGKTVKVIKTKVLDKQAPAGKFTFTKEGVEAGCGKGSVLLIRVKPEGKDEMSARDWYNGVRL